MPHADPQIGDVYLASPSTSVDGDKHGDNARPVGVVERLKHVANCVGRTTHPEPGAMTEPSAKNPELGLTKHGHWQNRHMRPVPRGHWGTPAFRFKGTLPDTEKDALIAFWARVKLVGRARE